jgi:hypothetical protein
MDTLMDLLIVRAVGLWLWLRYPRAVLFAAWRSVKRGRLPTVGDPLSGDDKFVWRKVFDHDPRLTRVVDKIAVKDWVAETVPGLSVPRLLWAGRDPAAIPDDVLAGPIAVKANHGCHTNLFFPSGVADRRALEATARKWLALRHGTRRMEWAYFGVTPQVLVEELLCADRPEALQELKYYTFGPRIERLVQIVDRFGTKQAARYNVDAGGSLIARPVPAEVSPRLWTKGLPESAVAAEAFARQIGAMFDHMRVDLLTDGTTVWLGEMTVYNLAGRFTGTGADPSAQMSRAWDLRRSTALRSPASGWRAVYFRALRRRIDRRDGPFEG